MKSDNAVPVRIMDREFLVACEENEQEDVIASAEFINGKIREISQGSRVIGPDRLVVLAALNIANDLLHVKADRDRYAQSAGRLNNLQNRIETALEQIE